MSDKARPTMQFELRIAGVPATAMRVLRFSADEAVNELYELSIDVVCASDTALEDTALEHAASFSFTFGEKRRVFHGVVRTVWMEGIRPQLGDRDHTLVAYRIEVAPRAWLMSRRRNTRIFQKLRVDEVIRTVLAHYHIPSRWVLEHDYPKRDYCTQYEETDLAFVQRLCAESGILTFFDQPSDMMDPLAEITSGLPAEAQEAVRAAADLGAQAVGGAVAGALGGLGGAAGGLSSQLLSQVPGLLGRPREVMVFADASRAYPPVRFGDGPPWQDMADALAGTLRAAVASQLPGAVANLADEGMRAGLSALHIGSQPTLHMRGDHQALNTDDDTSVTKFRRKRTVGSKRFTFREYDFRRPQAELTATKRMHGPTPQAIVDRVTNSVGSLRKLAQGDASSLMSQLRPDTGVLSRLLSPEQMFEIYEHHSGHLFPDWEYARHEPERMGRAATRQDDLAEGVSLCPWLEAGRRFRLEGHGIGRINRDYVVVAVRHAVDLESDGEERTYRNTFSCVPAAVTYVPQRPERRCVQVCLTATTLAADASHIHTEGGAQVKVRFHWDRGQPEHAFNTCWVRVMQSWAGAGWGSLFIPRAGMEVVVIFEGGDPDRPMVMGCVYNGTNPPPFVLPEHKTRSGFRTQTTPGVEGANELWFDDASGHEQLYLHAQKDYGLDVEHDRTVTVQHDDRVAVHGDHRTRISGHAHRNVVQDDETVVGQDARLEVQGSRQTQIAHDDRYAVNGDVHTHVGGAVRDVSGGARQQITEGDMVAKVRGNLSQVVGDGDAPRSMTTHVEGRYQVSASKTLKLSADEAIEISVGQTLLRLEPEKAILKSKELMLAGQGARVRLMVGEARLQADDKIQGVSAAILMKSDGAALGLGSEASVEGARVLLNSPQEGSDELETTPEEPTVIELTDQDGNPIPNHPYRIVMADGSEMNGVVDDDGRAEIILDGDGEVFFPGLHDVEEQ